MIFLAVLVTAAVISNKSIDLSIEQEQALTDINLGSYDIIDYSLGVDKVERCLYKEGAINTCNKFQTYYLNCSKFEIIETEECVSWVNETYIECISWDENETCIEESEFIREICSETTIIYSNGKCLTWKEIYYTEQEILNILDDWEEERIRLIADVKISRDSRDKTIIREGVTTIR